jgi:hypothetical protein
MMRFQRPVAPGTFAATVDPERTRIAAEIRAKRKPVIDKPLWSQYKAELSKAQNGRCGYCELPVTAGAPGDVEHYAPKNDIKGFTGVAGEEGKEVSNSYKVKGRTPTLLSEQGYWWLAYDWSNYLLACWVCNGQWKGNLFPTVPSGRTRRLPPTRRTKETALLLNPYGPEDPADHLQFNDDGSVEPFAGSERGRETIRTVGLHRVGLVFERLATAEDAYMAVAEARDDMNGGVPAADNRGLRSLHRQGQPHRHHPGVVRAIIRQQLGMDWSELDRLFGRWRWV